MGWVTGSKPNTPVTAGSSGCFTGWSPPGLPGVTIAANSILFIIAWEFMALGAFFLVTTEDEDRAVREAGWIYLVATHTAALALFALFALMHNATGSFALTAVPAGSTTTAIFLLAVAGFGLKAGIMPLHVWFRARMRWRRAMSRR